MDICFLVILSLTSVPTFILIQHCTRDKKEYNDIIYPLWKIMTIIDNKYLYDENKRLLSHDAPNNAVARLNLSRLEFYNDICGDIEPLNIYPELIESIQNDFYDFEHHSCIKNREKILISIISRNRYASYGSL